MGVGFFWEADPTSTQTTRRESPARAHLEFLRVPWESGLVSVKSIKATELGYLLRTPSLAGRENVVSSSDHTENYP